MLTTLLKHSWAETLFLNEETETNDSVIQTKILSAVEFDCSHIILLFRLLRPQVLAITTSH